MNNFRSSTYRIYCLLAILYFVLFLLASCSPLAGRSGATGIADEQLDGRRKVISMITDNILIALAARNYENLADYIEPGRFPSAQNDSRLIGLMTARRLLGSSAATVIIEQWDIDTVEITFDDDQQQANAKIAVKHRKTPNRQPRVDQFIFRFYFFKELNQWRLYVP